MNGLPKDFDASFFLGRELQVITFGPFQVSLVFDGLSVHIESAYAINAEERVEIPLKSSCLMRLLMDTVTSARGDEDGTLTLGFESGASLRVFDSNENTESYNIGYEGGFIIV